jgi:hypothetical protein
MTVFVQEETSLEKSNASAYESFTFLIPSSLTLACPGPFSSDYPLSEPATDSGLTSSMLNCVSINGLWSGDDDRVDISKVSEIEAILTYWQGSDDFDYFVKFVDCSYRSCCWNPRSELSQYTNADRIL